MGDSRKRTNSNQFAKLVELMDQNADIAKGIGAFGSSKRSQKEYWDRFAIDLNSLGPPSREGKDWHKVWLDYKLKTKKKIEANKKNITATGGGQYTQLSLSPLEQAVDNLLGLQHAVNPSGIRFGLSAHTSLAATANTNAAEETEQALLERFLNDADEEQQVPESAETEQVQRPSPSRQQGSLSTGSKVTNSVNARECERMKLLQDQTDKQSQLLDVSKSIDKNLSEIVRYARKTYELEKEKVCLLKAKEKRKEKENIEKNKRHKEKVELKLKKLDIEMQKLDS